MKIKEWFLSFFFIFYVLYALESSLFPGMGLKRYYIWPWSMWRLFEGGGNHNHSLTALGYTRSGKTVVVDVEAMFEHLCGGHQPGLLPMLDGLFTVPERNKDLKDRFCENVLQRYNRKVADESEKLSAMDLYGLSWSKDRHDQKKDVVTRLFYRHQI